MAKVININAERWTTVFSRNGIRVLASTKGSIYFTVKDRETGEPTVSQVLEMPDAMDMFRALATAYGAEDVTGKDEEEDGRPYPAV